MAIFVGTLALTGGTFVLGRYLMALLSVAKGAEYLAPNPLWGAIGFTVAVLGGLLFLI